MKHISHMQLRDLLEMSLGSCFFGWPELLSSWDALAWQATSGTTCAKW